MLNHRETPYTIMQIGLHLDIVCIKNDCVLQFYRREYIIHISSDREFLIGIPTRKIWKETLYDFREYTQRHWMAIALFHSLLDVTLRIDHNDGIGHRI